MPSVTGKSVTVLGVKETQAAMDAIGRDITLSKKADKDAAALVARTAATYGPDRSGKLSGSYRPLGSKKRGRVVSRLIYAKPIEFGWPFRGIEPQRRVQRAIEANAAQLQAIYEAYCREVLAKRAGKG